MCGRYASMRDTADLVLLTGAADETASAGEAETVPPQSANVAPTDPVRVLLQIDGRRVLRSHRWGLVPPWSKDMAGAARMINARIETIAQKPSYRRALRTARCVLPADGWYEWQRSDTGRTPFLVRRADGRPLWLAGVWARWHPPGGGSGEVDAVSTVAVVTGPAPSELEWLHERAPLAVPDRSVDQWLASDGSDPQPALEMLAGAGYPPLAWHPVSREIGNVRIKGAHLMEPVPGMQAVPPVQPVPPVPAGTGGSNVGSETSTAAPGPLALF
jgi:putative SOS response-associated peptidase YedK